MNPTAFKAKVKGFFIALKFSPDNITKFDQTNRDLNIEYLLFANYDFEKLIDNAGKLNIKIRDIIFKEIDENLQEELDKYLIREDYHNLAIFIDKNFIIIKEIEFLFNNIIIRVYDSGIIWSDSNLPSSTQLIQLIESILDLVE